MATALARRGAGLAAAALAWGRGMCSASARAAAGRAAALSSEELMRMERDCSAHKYVRPFPPLSKPVDLLACAPAACLPKCICSSPLPRVLEPNRACENGFRQNLGPLSLSLGSGKSNLIPLFRFLFFATPRSSYGSVSTANRVDQSLRPGIEAVKNGF
jgi:hypothetical protein